MKTKILIIEDEERVAELLSDYLKKDGFEPEIINNGLDAIPHIKENKPALILLDLMLPGKDGLSICKELRKFSDIPVIIITAKVEEIDRLIGLEIGADDYVCKPFSFREVVSRVKVVLRRTIIKESLSSEDGILLDESCFKVLYNQKSMELTSIEFYLFKVLKDNPGRIYSRDQLMDHIYPDRRIVSDRTIDSHIRKLRKKLSEIVGDKEIIFSVYSAGYRYENI